MKEVVEIVAAILIAEFVLYCIRQAIAAFKQ
jgi:hypothetical protein